MRATSFSRPTQRSYNYKKPESPTVTGLLIMLIAGIIIIISYFSDDVLGGYFYYGQSLTTLGFIGLIIAFFGFLKIYGDRFSYPEPHPNNMRQALIFYIVGIILSVGPILFMIVYINTGGFGTITSVIRIIFYIIFIFSIVGPLLWIFGRYKVLFSLLPVYRRSFLMIAYYIFIIAVLISVILYILLITHYYSDYYLTSGIIKNLYLLSHIFFTICFFFAYDYQKQNSQLQRY